VYRFLACAWRLDILLQGALGPERFGIYEKSKGRALSVLSLRSGFLRRRALCKGICLHFAMLPLLDHKDPVNYVCLNSAQFFCVLHSARKLTRKHNQCVVISCERARKKVISKCASGIFLGKPPPTF
jgi:hypothetical protein